MNNNINAGADFNAGDGGYSESTKEKYDEFVKIRNQSLGKTRIKELAVEAEFSEKDLHIQGDNFQKFAELLIRECAQFTDSDTRKFILKHFGVE